MSAFLQIVGDIACYNPTLTFLALGASTYFVLSYLLKPKLHDRYFEVDESKFYELKYVGKHSKDIPLEDISGCIQEMKAVYHSNITRRVQDRKKQLTNLKRLLENNTDKIASAIKKDLGRNPLLGAVYDVYPVIGEINKFIKNLDAWTAPQRLWPSLMTFPSMDFEVSEPYGTVFVNGIWNFPFQLACSPIAGAIAAGNNVVFRPCNTANHCARLLADLLDEYMDHKFVQVVGHPDVGDDYATTDKILDNKFDMIFFTGSSNGGKYVMQKAAQFLTPVVLELGGKNPVIVDDTADLNVAARQCVSARVVNCGQQCISPDYVLCYERVVDKFIEECVGCAKEWYSSENMKDDLGANQARMISKREWDRVKAMLENTEGEVVHGGRCDEETLMIEPTIVKLKNIRYIGSEESMKRETFGPVLWVVPVNNDIKEAVAYVNRRAKPLSLYMFSKSSYNQNYVMYNTSSGGLQINGTLTYAAHTGGRFGGVDQSGIGSYHGKHSFDTFSHTKPVIRSMMDNPMLYPPYSGSLKERVFKFGFGV